MLPTTRRSNHSVSQLQREIDDAFDRVWNWSNGGMPTASESAAYPVDIREDDNHVIVEAELPGFKKDDINVTMEQGVLSIDAQRREEKHPEEEHHLHERRFNRVSRSFRLPQTVDENNVSASHDNGVLTLTLPKREEVKPRRIEIQDRPRADSSSQSSGQ